MVQATLRLPTTNDVRAAQVRISRYVLETPLIYSPIFAHRYGVAVYVKADSCTATGAFKLRGAMNALCCLTEEEKQKGVVAFSTGNHAQAVAYGAGLLRIAASIIMPVTAPSVKIANTKALGANVILYNPDEECREQLAQQYTEQGMALIHPYDNFKVIAGQGVAGLECAAQLVQLGVKPDRFYLPISGGGYAAGFSIGKDAHFPDAEVVGIEPEVSAPWQESLRSNENVQITPTGKSLCDAIMPPVPRPGALPWAILMNRITHIDTVADDDVLLGMACAMKYFGLVTEPSGACGLGVVFKDREVLSRRTIVVAVSGRNVDPEVLDRAMALRSQV